MALSDSSGTETSILSRIKLAVGWLSKKTVYLILSTALVIFLLSSFVADVTALLLTENVDQTTQGYTFTIFLLHAILFYLSLMAFVFSSKYGGRRSFQAWFSLIILVANTALFLFRIYMEIVYIGYREELYTLHE